MKSTPPICKCFLVLNRFAILTANLLSLVFPDGFSNGPFPAALPLAFFARLTSARGAYQVHLMARSFRVIHRPPIGSLTTHRFVRFDVDAYSRLSATGGFRVRTRLQRRGGRQTSLCG